MVKRAQDARKRPQIGADVMFAVMLLGFAHRIKSLEEPGREMQKGRYRKVVPRGTKLPSHDTIRRALCQWDLEALQASHDQFVTKFKQRKGSARGAIDDWRVAALDGVKLFSTVVIVRYGIIRSPA